MADLFVWTLDDLLRRSEHPDEAVRAWALARLGRTRSPAAFKTMLRALRDPSAAVVLEALRAIHTHGHRFDLTPALADLRAIALRGSAPSANVHRLAEIVLLRLGDEAAIERVMASCFGPEDNPTAPYLALFEAAPERVLARVEASGLLTQPSAQHSTAVILLPRVVPLALLPALYATVNQTDDKTVSEALLHELLLRAASEHLCDLGNEPLEEVTDWLKHRAEAAPGSDPDPCAQWLSLGAFDGCLRALEGRQWAKAIAWCDAWSTSLDHDDDRNDDTARWGAGLMKLLRAERAPRGLHAYTAVSLAVAASERALERARPFAACDLTTQMIRTAFSSDTSWHARAAVLCMRWSSPRRREATEAAMRRAVEALTLAPPFVFAALLRLAARLPGFTLPSTVLDAAERDPEVAGPDLRRYLEAHPQALRVLAPLSLDAREGRAQHEVLQSLGAHNAVWVSELLAPRLEGLVRSDYPELVLGALESLGDASPLPRLVALWTPGAEHVARTAVHLARIDGSVDRLPAALVAEDEARRARAQAA